MVKKNLKIAYIGAKEIFSGFGGVEAHVEQLSKYLAAKGNSIDVYVRICKENKEKLPGISLKRSFGIKNKYLDALSYSFTASLSCCIRNYDIIHFHALGPSIFAFFPHLISKKVVITIHRLDWKAEKWGWLGRNFLKFCEKIIIHNFPVIVVVSKSLQQYFKEKYAKDTIYIPNGINLANSGCLNTSFLDKYGLERKKYIFWIGRITPEKKLEYLINTYNKLDNPQLKLVISGGPSRTENYFKKIKFLISQNKNIVFTGVICGEEKQCLFENAYIFVSASSVEGLPITLLEAASYGLICLVSDIDAHREIISDGENGFIFKDLEETLKKVLNMDADSLEKICHQAKKRVRENYSWDKIIDQIESLYYKMLNGTR